MTNFPSQAASTGTTATIYFDHILGQCSQGQPPIPTSPLRSLQTRLHSGRLWWLGNRVSDLRYWLWRLSR